MISPRLWTSSFSLSIPFTYLSFPYIKLPNGSDEQHKVHSEPHWNPSSREKERKIVFRQIQTSHTHGVPKTHINTLNLSLEQGPQPLSKKKKTAPRKIPFVGAIPQHNNLPLTILNPLKNICRCLLCTTSRHLSKRGVKKNFIWRGTKIPYE